MTKTITAGSILGKMMLPQLVHLFALKCVSSESLPAHLGQNLYCSLRLSKPYALAESEPKEEGSADYLSSDDFVSQKNSLIGIREQPAGTGASFSSKTAL